MLRLFQVRAISFILLSFFLSVSISNATNVSSSAKMNINKATVKQLVKVKGVGKAKADKIVAFLKKGEIQSMNELKKVKGIGEKVLSSIEEKFEVKKTEKKNTDK